MGRFLAILFLAATGGAVLAYGDLTSIEKAGHMMTHVFSAQTTLKNMRSVEILRGNGGEFALYARINDVKTSMVIDTGATSVVLTSEAAEAAGLPLELLNYNVEIETANGHTRAARVTLDRLAIGRLVERSVPALVVPQGQMKTNLLGMSFLDRLESWEVRAEKLILRGYP